MSAVYVRGAGVVSPAGWGLEAFRDALAKANALPAETLAAPQGSRRMQVRRVPKGAASHSSHPRLRRASPITAFSLGAACEALALDLPAISSGHLNLGIVYCVLSGCVNYSRRFYEETLNDPATASPLIFPETVFNAPASHLGAFFKSHAPNYTLVGDQGVFLQGLTLAAEWLSQELIDGCLVVGAEEVDWVTATALQLFARDAILSEGAGALYLSRTPSSAPAIQLAAVTEPISFSTNRRRSEAALLARAQIDSARRSGKVLLCGGMQRSPRLDRAEEEAWRDWSGPRIMPKMILGDAIVAGAGWQCVAAVDALRYDDFDEAIVNVVGINQQAGAALFRRD